MVLLMKVINTRNISIKKSVILVFMSVMMITLCGIGYLVFMNWFSSARQTTENIAGKMSESIYGQIISFMYVPNQINETNHKILASGILDLNNEKIRDKFFVGVLSSYDDEIYSFSYGTATGEYYGARKNENGIIEIMKNNASTRGNSWYYSVNEDLTAGELVVQAGKFDPRTRAWYQAAEAAGGPILSPVYKHFVMDDLTISAAWPVYNEEKQLQGVLGTHMLLSGIGTFLEHTVSSYHGYAIIAEKDTGALIANSLGEDNFSVLQDGTFERRSISDLRKSDLREAYQRYSDKQDAHFLYAGENEKLYINVREIHMEGVDWVVMSAIPEGLLMNNVKSKIGRAHV
jgi:hypothetical protein